MMTEMRHNFIKRDRLSSQIIEYLEHRFHDQTHEDMRFEIKKRSEKPWHSSTYAGQIQHYTISISSANGHDIHENIDWDQLYHGLESYEFNMRKSFVADIKIANKRHNHASINLDIEAKIIFEE